MYEGGHIPSKCISVKVLDSTPPKPREKSKSVSGMERENMKKYFTILMALFLIFGASSTVLAGGDHDDDRKDGYHDDKDKDRDRDYDRKRHNDDDDDDDDGDDKKRYHDKDKDKFKHKHKGYFKHGKYYHKNGKFYYKHRDHFHKLGKYVYKHGKFHYYFDK